MAKIARKATRATKATKAKPASTRKVAARPAAKAATGARAATTGAGSELRAIALGYPGTHEDFPWGQSAFKVAGKVFLFMSLHQDALHISVKLPSSSQVALMLPFVEPTGYGLGKSGWVSANFPGGKNVPIDMLRDWIDESFRAIAPKKLVATLRVFV